MSQLLHALLIAMDKMITALQSTRNGSMMGTLVMPCHYQNGHQIYAAQVMEKPLTFAGFKQTYTIPTFEKYLKLHQEESKETKEKKKKYMKKKHKKKQEKKLKEK